MLHRPFDTRTMILAYLGELKPEEFIPVRILIFDLNLRFTTAKNTLTKLEQDWLVEKKITVDRGTMASFRISPTAVMEEKINGIATGRSVPFVPPEWNPQYGRHPHGL
jgi:hypothetical protein